MKELDKNYIKKELSSFALNIETVAVADSTNTIMKERAKQGEREFSVLLAAEQTAGRGRLGRNFFSPEGTGIYFSLLLRPNEETSPITITTDAAVACSRAFEKLTGERAGIKWVNDIYMRGRKVCGILTEASFGENGYAVLGIGANVCAPEDGFPADIKDRAGSIFLNNEEHLREKTAVEILKEFICVHTKENRNVILEEYRKKSIVIGKTLEIIKPHSVENAVALSVEDDYSLLVRKENGNFEKLSSGDVSIKI